MKTRDFDELIAEALTEEELEGPRRTKLIELAQSYFELAVQTSREIPR